MNNYNNKTQFPVVDPLTGEYMMLLKNKKQFTGINDKFIKFFIPLIDKLHLMIGELKNSKNRSLF